MSYQSNQSKKVYISNISNEKCDVRLKDFAQMCAECNGKDVVFDLPTETEMKGFSIAMQAVLDNSKLKGIGFVPKYEMKDAEYKEFVMSKQVYRSGTSVGANVRETKHAQSDADFLSKMSIAYKEADESDYWLNLLHDNGYLNDEQFESLSHDCTRIIKILTSIVKTMKTKIDENNNH